MDLPANTCPPQSSGRAVPIREMSWICKSALALRNLGTDAEHDGTAPIHPILSAVCSECGIRLTTAELLTLASIPSSEDDAQPRLGRLRRGYCARTDCTSHFYWVELRLVTGITWNDIDRATASENLLAERAASKLAGLASNPRWPRQILSLRNLGKVGLALALASFILLARRWHIGGSIPIIREPEIFQIAPECITPPPP